MRPYFLLSVFSLVLVTSCKKDEPEPPSTPNTPCNCGTVMDDPINNGVYQLIVRNDCSGNWRTFNVSYDDWFNNHVGEKTCFSNVSSW